MRTTLMLSLSLLTFGVYAQNLFTSRQSSTFTWIYRISNEEAARIYTAKSWKADETFLHTLVDSFPVGSNAEPDLPPGHYLKTTIYKNKLSVALATVQDYDVQLFNNVADLCILVHDSIGRILPDAVVKANRKSIHFDEKAQFYRLAKANKKGWLTVEYGGLKTWYSLNRDLNNPTWKRILNRKPLRYIWQPVRFVTRFPIDAYQSIARGGLYSTIYQSKRFFTRLSDGFLCLFNEYYCEEDASERFGKKWKGYWVFNKPKYQPRDTVYFKAFMTNKKGRPLTDSAFLVLQKNSNDEKRLALLAPHHPGAYSGSFVLHDSLGLRLDQYYTVALQRKKDRPYIEGQFRYEDYELHSTNLALRSETKAHFRGQDFEIFLKGTDENDLNLADARVEITLRPLRPLLFWEKEVFLPDTLWHWEEALEPAGETAIAIPDSIFPALNLEYEAHVVMLTADNERVEQRETFKFYHQWEELRYELKGDSIQFFYQHNGKKQPYQARLSAYTALGKELSEQLVELPHQEKLNTHFQSYELKSGDLYLNANLLDEPSLLTCASNRTADSVHVVVENPRYIPFRYFIYDLDREIARGYGTTLDWQQATGHERVFNIVLQYLWAGRIKENNFNVRYYPKVLNVNVDQPALIYPGQTTDIHIAVTDQQGRPVPDVDLTAYGLTAKFHPGLPELPVFDQKKLRSRRGINNFSISNPALQGHRGDLNFDAWRRKAGLDTIEYYRFLYPGRQLYRFEVETKDSTTQFSPFIVSDGTIKAIHVVYLDYKPVYFSWSEMERPYAFRVTPGYHRVMLRTSDQLVQIDSLYFPPHKKLIFSLVDSFASKQVSITPMPPVLEEQEKNNLYRYIFPFREVPGELFSYLEQGEEIALLRNKDLSAYNRGYVVPRQQRLLAGPILPNYALFVKPDDHHIDFLPEPFFEYEFIPGLLKMRSVDGTKSYPEKLNFQSVETLTDRVLTREQVLEKRRIFLETQRWQRVQTIQHPNATPFDKGKLAFGLSENKTPIQSAIWVFFYAGDTTFSRIYPSENQVFHALSPGNYRLMLLWPNGQYAPLGSVKVKSGGLTHYRLSNPVIQPQDSFSVQLQRKVEKYLSALPQPGEKEVWQNRPSLNTEAARFSFSGPQELRRGRITDETGEPLIGATVLVKGTLIGTVTDIDGYYELYAPEGSTLVFSYTGYNSTELVAEAGAGADVMMHAGAQLSEVVVTGYGIKQKEKNLLTSEEIRGLATRNINALSAQTAGLSRADEGGAIKIRGEATIHGSRSADLLYYVDGIRIEGKLIPYSENSIVKTELLSAEDAMKLLGPEAVNGAVLITTRKGAKGADYDEAFYEAASQASSIRTNFSDYAFWQPILKTDAQGKASFKVTFPDDMTRWSTFVVAMNDKRQTGSANGSIRSFKPLSARLNLPRFLVEGDSTWAIGKVLNYTPDTVTLRAGFAIGDQEAVLRDFRIVDAAIDSVLLAPMNTDSMQVKFLLQKSDGYTDGEQHEIGVFPKGVERVAGQFVALENDTTFTWSFPDSLGPVKLYARADLLEVVEEEIARLIDYEYDCNEQMASRLKALLAEQQIATFKGKDFTRKTQAQKLVNRLLDNQNDQGLWGWWNQSSTSYWISTHILEALGQARKMGYKVQIPEAKIAEQVVWELESNTSNVHKLEILYLMRGFNAKPDYKAYLAQLEKDTAFSVLNRLKLMELKQGQGMPWNRDTLAHYRRETLFGNVYYASDQPDFFLSGNTLQTTLAAYRLIQRDSTGDKTQLRRIRNYFLEQRSNGHWNNTYETAQILAVLLPDLKPGTAAAQKPSLRLSGAVATQVDQFPYQATFEPGKSLTLSKSGDYPVYFTAYQRYRDANPHENSEYFTIRTAFASGNNRLRAGKPETLEVTIDVHKEVQYAMIEVPIPASCSYESKHTNYGKEAHREYFRHKTSIFCENLKPGKHRFTIELLPRYSGSFVLNPAKVELMYFPVFQSNNEVKRVEVRR